MKKIFALATLCALGFPTVALGQTAPAPMPPRPEMSTRFKQFHDQMERAHRAERAQVLAALTPAHRALLANIVGEQAIAMSPDYKAAAARLDAALSPSEKSAVLAAHTTAMTQMRDTMRAMRDQMKPPPGAPQPQGSMRPRWRDRDGSARHEPTAGEVVLMVAGAHAEMIMHGMGMPPMPPGPGMMRYHNPGMQGPPEQPEPAHT